MKLSTLIQDMILTDARGKEVSVSAVVSTLSHDPDIRAIRMRAQDVQTADMFVAIKGFTADGHDYIHQAIENGAGAIVSEKPVQADVPVLLVKNTRHALSAAAAVFYGNPSRDLILVGVTGTNGKTTTVAMIETMIACAGHTPAVIGTVDCHYLGRSYPAPNTTPESLWLQKRLADMKRKGVTHVIMEVSSHALDLFRVEHCDFDVCVHTNLTQDHLDFHHTMDRYWTAKTRLFTDLLCESPKRNRAKAVINIQDEHGRSLPGRLSVPVITTGNGAESGVRAIDTTFTLSGITGTLMVGQDAISFSSSAVGKHNLENILNAVGTAVALGFSLQTIREGIQAFRSVPGRLEPVTSRVGLPIFIDYAHTPDALEQVLSVLRPLVKGRLITVFGCGGDRDRKKRPIMGSIAATLSDITIVTSDNPRTEDPDAIIRDILKGVSGVTDISPFHPGKPIPAKGYLVAPDRRQAIQWAIETASKEDAVIIAGKGHETYQTIGRSNLPFSDRKEAEQAVAAKETNAAIIPWTVEALLTATHGRLISPGRTSTFSTIGIDSRTIVPDAVFVAIRGDRFDGHDFIEGVIQKGIRAVILNHSRRETLAGIISDHPEVTFISVEDTTRALGDLAAFLRRKSRVHVVALTGSNGKTTTKEMIAAVLGTRFQTLKTQGNLNNHIGLPLTLFNLTEGDEWAVLEMGMNHFGEIQTLTEICSPDIGVVTNVAEAHLEGLGSIQGVAEAKGELPRTLGKDATLILNGEDPHVADMGKHTAAKVIYAGFSKTAQCQAASIRESLQGIDFILTLPSGETDTIRLKVSGRFMVTNALAAAAAGFTAGVPMNLIKRGLETFVPAPGRLTIVPTEKGFYIIDDAYNANPGSMQGAITTLTELKGSHRGIGVLGDMLELGGKTASLHRSIGEKAAISGMARLFLTGQHACDVKNGALSGGMKDTDIVIGTKDRLMEELRRVIDATDWILVKGSRAMGMETIVQGLKKWGDEA